MWQVPCQRSSLPELRDPHFTSISPALSVSSVCDIKGRANYTFLSLNIHTHVECSVCLASLSRWDSVGSNRSTGSPAPLAASLKGEMLSWKSRTQKVFFIGECQDFTLPPCLSFTFMTSSPEHCEQLTPPMDDATLMYPPVTEGLLYSLIA